MPDLWWWLFMGIGLGIVTAECEHRIREWKKDREFKKNGYKYNIRKIVERYG